MSKENEEKLKLERKQFIMDNLEEFPELEGFTDIDNIIIKESSGESFTYIFKEYGIVIKIFYAGTKYSLDYTSHTLETEVSNVNDCDSEYLNEIIRYRNIGKLGYIIYKYYEMISLEQLQKMTEKDFLGFLLGISLALKDIHTKGYIHGDVGIDNIGQDIDGTYILIDTETINNALPPRKNTNSSIYNDMEMFFMDLKIKLLRHTLEKKKLELLEIVFESIKLKSGKISIKKKWGDYNIYPSYKPDTFYNSIIEIIDGGGGAAAANTGTVAANTGTAVANTGAAANVVSAAVRGKQKSKSKKSKSKKSKTKKSKKSKSKKSKKSKTKKSK